MHSQHRGRQLLDSVCVRIQVLFTSIYYAHSSWLNADITHIVKQLLAGCALLAVCAVLQPKHKEVELFQRRAAARALRYEKFVENPLYIWNWDCPIAYLLYVWGGYD